MGSFEFGIYVYVWTWVLLLGQLLDLGLGTAAQKFIPEYRERNALASLRGFLSGSRWLTFAFATAIAALCAGVVRLLQPWLDDYTVIPLYIGCLALPAYALSSTQDGIARSFDWVGLGLVPTNIIRQVLLTCFMAAAYFAALPMDATVALVVAGLSIWLPTLGQMLMLNRRLADARRKRTESSPPQDLAGHLPADSGGGKLLRAACLFRHTGAAAVPPAGRGCGLLRGRQDAGARRSHLLRGVGHRRASFQRLSGRRRSRRPRRLCRAVDPSDVLAVACRHLAAARVRAADPRPVRRRNSLPAITSCSSLPSACWRAHPSGPSSDSSICWASSASARWSMPAPSCSISSSRRYPGAGIRSSRRGHGDFRHADRGIDPPLHRHQAAARLACLHLEPRRTALRAKPCTGRSTSAIASSGARSRSLLRTRTTWRALAARALEPNVFYEPAFALAAAPVFGGDAGAGLVWARDNPTPAARPVSGAHRKAPLWCAAVPLLVGWTHPYGPFGAPLVDRDAAEAVIAAWLQHVAAAADLPKVLLLPYLPAEGRWRRHLCLLFATLAATASCLWRVTGARCSRQTAIGAAISIAPIGHKKRKELRRQRKRLADLGALTSDSAREARSAVHSALDDFLALESAGWKGRAGTAARAIPPFAIFW